MNSPITEIGRRVLHDTCYIVHQFQGQRSRSQARIVCTFHLCPFFIEKTKCCTWRPHCLFTSDKKGGTCFCPCLFVCLSVCLFARLLKMRAWIWIKCCVSTDIGTWTNWLTFEPDPDYSPDAGTGLLYPISYKRCYAGFYVGKIPLAARRSSEPWF